MCVPGRSFNFVWPPWDLSRGGFVFVIDEAASLQPLSCKSVLAKDMHRVNNIPVTQDASLNAPLFGDTMTHGQALHELRTKKEKPCGFYPPFIRLRYLSVAASFDLNVFVKSIMIHKLRPNCLLLLKANHPSKMGAFDLPVFF
jgi:hypothetical protein